MNFKSKILIVCILLLFVFSVGCSFASSDMNNLQAADDSCDDVIEVSDEDTSSLDDSSEAKLSDVDEGLQMKDVSSEDALSAPGDKSLKELNETVDSYAVGSTIDLQDNYTYAEGDDNYPIIISKPITIDGHGHTIDFTNAVNEMIVIISSDVTLRNITFINLNSSNAGTIGIEFANNTLIEYCNFNNCSSEYGAAITCEETSGVTIRHCNFDDCSAVMYQMMGPVMLSAGGAIVIYDADNVAIDNCNFENCYSNGYGGAICLNTVNGTVSNCNFTNNSAMSGGAVIIDPFILMGPDISWENSSNVVVDNCIFKNNFASGGGAIGSIGNNTRIYNSKFYNNYALDAGAVGFFGPNGTIHNCEFADNYAFAGGAVFMGASSYMKEFGDSIIDNSTFINNTAEIGGAVFWYNDNGTLKDSVFINNSISGLYEKLKDLFIADKKDYFLDDGYYEEIDYYDYILNNLDNSLALEVEIDFGMGISFTSQVPFISDTLGHGGAVYWVGDNGTITGSNFTANNAAYGGAILSLMRYNENLLNVTSSTFVGNFATLGSGGAIFYYAKDENGNGKISNSRFDDNYVVLKDTSIYHIPLTEKTSGGAITWAGSYGLVEFSNFTNNRADYGAAIAFSELSAYGFKILDSERCTVSNSNFKNNRGYYGGAVFYEGLFATCLLSNFTLNNATYGGAIYCEEWGEILNSSFTGNNATYGGAVFANKSFDLSFSSFTQNNAVWGGAFCGGECDSYLSNFTANNATYGGAIYSEVAEDIYYSNFNENTAIYGGAIDSGSIAVIACDFTGNNATYGGVLYTDNAVESEYSNFTSNFGVYGGVICADEASIYESNFTQNHGIRGGVLYLTDKIKNMTNSLFNNNSAVIGGAMYLNCNEMQISNCQFIFNSADNGSAIYAEKFLALSNCVVLNNKAKSDVLITNVTVNDDNITVGVIYTGNDNLLNGIYSVSGIVNFNNVTFWGVKGLSNTDLDEYLFSNREAGQNITFVLSNFIEAIDYREVKSTNLTGEATVEFNEIPAGRYHLLTAFMENDYYTEIRNTEVIIMGSPIIPIELDVEDISYGENATVNVTLGFGVTGNVTINLDGVNLTVLELDNGFASLNLTGLAGGIHDVMVYYYSDDGNFAANNATKSFRVNPIASSIIVKSQNGYYNSPIAVNVTVLPVDATGKVIITIADIFGETLNITDSNNLSAVISKLNAGNYTIEAFYTGDRNYTFSYDNTTIEIKAINLTASVDVTNATDVNVTFTINVPYDFKGKVNITVGNVSEVYDIEGSCQVGFVKLDVGNKTAVLRFYDDGNYLEDVVESNFTVSSSKDVPVKPVIPDPVNPVNAISIKSDNTIRGFNSPYDYQAAFLDSEGNALINSEVLFIVNNVTYSVITNASGIAQLKESKLPVGVYNITAVNLNTLENETRELKIVERIVERSDMTMEFFDGSYYVVKVIGDDGNIAPKGEVISIRVNGVSYPCKVDKNGLARLKINLNPKTYIITAEYKTYTQTNKLVVKQTLKLVKKTVKVKKGKKVVLMAKLKWENGKAIKGKKIVFNFKDKKYVKYTNKKGVAKVIIKKKKILKKLKKGRKYRFIATYRTNIVKGWVKVKK